MNPLITTAELALVYEAARRQPWSVQPARRAVDKRLRIITDDGEIVSLDYDDCDHDAQDAKAEAIELAMNTNAQVRDALHEFLLHWDDLGRDEAVSPKRVENLRAAFAAMTGNAR